MKVRVAVDTGLVEPRGDDDYGPAINLAARRESLTNGGQILISAIRALTEGRGSPERAVKLEAAADESGISALSSQVVLWSDLFRGLEDIESYERLRDEGRALTLEEAVEVTVTWPSPGPPWNQVQCAYVVDVAPVLERQMHSQCLVDTQHQRRRHGTKCSPHSLDGNGTHLFCLYLRIPFEPALVGRNKNLERIHPSDLGRHRSDGDNASAESGCSGVCAVIAHDDGRSLAGGFTRQRLAKIDQADLSAKHQMRPSDVVLSQSAASSESSHSSHASA